MSIDKSLLPLEALNILKENNPELNSIEKILDIPDEDKFIELYAEKYFNGDRRKTRKAYRQAQRIQERITLLWANIKDAIASPSIKETLFNNIPDTFIEHQQSIPGYDRLFGNLDFTEFDPARSIFSPAAYFVDLLRFIEKYIPQDKLPRGHSLEKRQPRLFRIPLDRENTYNLIPYIDLVNEVLEDIIRTNEKPNPYRVVEEAKFPMQLPFHLPLEEIRIYLKQLKISLTEIYELFEARETEIAREAIALSPREYQLLKHPIDPDELADFYGKEIEVNGKGSLEDVEIFTEQTGLSRKELNELLFLDLSNEEIQAGLSRLFFINNTGDRQGQLSIEENLERELFSLEFDNNLQKNLNNQEFSEELKSAFNNNNINLSEDIKILIDSTKKWRVWDSQKGVTYIIRHEDTLLKIYEEAYDRIVNLTPSKLDRIYRFLKLSRKLEWSFADLDWAVRSLQGSETTEKVLRFDGVNDFISIPQVHQQNSEAFSETFTLEAWIQPSVAGINPILAKGSPDGSFTQFLFWITEQGKLAFSSNIAEPIIKNWGDAIATEYAPSLYKKEDGELIAIDLQNISENNSNSQKRGLTLISDRQIPLGSFAHVAVTVNEKESEQTHYQLKFYINGRLDTIWSLKKPLPVTAKPNNIDRIDINIGRNFQEEFFSGNITEVRLWNEIRSQEEIKLNRFKRFSGREDRLMAYWPLIESADLQVQDLAAYDWTDNPKPVYHGNLGGESHRATPIWVSGDLALDSLLAPLSFYSYHFNGKDEYVGGKVCNLNLNSLTLEARVRIDKGDRIHPIICKGNAQENQTQYYLWIDSDNKLVFSNSSLNKHYKTDRTLEEGKFTHVAAVVSSDGVKLYIDGIQVKEFNESLSELEDSGDDLYLGRDFETNYLQGNLQEVRIWSTLRTSELDLRTRYHQLVGNEPGLQGYWRLDEPDPNSTPARDRTFNKNDLYPGGILKRYQPTLTNYEEAILPDPVATEAIALTFGENQYPVILKNTKNQGLGHYEQFSLQFWFKSYEPQIGDRKQILFTQGDRDTGLSIYLFDRQLHIYAWCFPFSVRDPESGTSPEREIHFDAIEIDPQKWYHLTLVYDETTREGITYRLYLDGISKGQYQQQFALDRIGDAYLGGLGADTFVWFHDLISPAGKNHYFQGQITDLRIWQIAISEAAIARRDLRHIPPRDRENLVCYLPMTEDYGRSVSNHIGPKYISDESDRGPAIPDLTPNRLHGNLYVGPDDITTKWLDASDLPVFPDTVLKLNNSQFVRLPNARELDLVDRSFSLEIWLQVSDFVADLPILAGVLGLTETGKIKLQIAEKELISDRSLNLKQWHHLAWRYDRSDRVHTLFIDGQIDSELLDTSSFSDPVPLNLGSSGQEIAELRVWKTPRTNQEIQQYWNRQLLETSDLTAHWQFDRDPRTQLVDRTANAYPALIETNTDIDAKWVEVEATPAWNRQSRTLLLNANPGVTPDFIELSTYSIQENGSIELWVKFASTENCVLLDASSENSPFLLEVRDRLLQFKVADSSNVAIPLPDSRSFHHIAIAWQFDSDREFTQIRLDLDEIEVSSQKIGNGLKPDFPKPYLGLNRGENLDAVQPFHGAIAQLRVWEGMKSHQDLQRWQDADLEGNEAGLVTYLPFDEGSGTTIKDIVSGNILKLQALSVPHPDPQWIEVDRAIQLDRIDDRIEISSYTPQESGAIELWLKLSPDRDRVLFDASKAQPDDDDDEDLNLFILELKQQKLRFLLSNGKDDDDDRRLKAEIDLSQISVSEFSAKWHHIVAVWDSLSSQNAKAILYLDERSSETSFRKLGQTNFNPLYIGKKRINRKDNDDRDRFNDLLEVRRVRIWNRMLFAEEIERLQLMPWQAISADLIVDLPIDRGTGINLPNLAGNNDPATLIIGESEDPDSKWIVVDRALELAGSETFIDCVAVPTNNGTIELWAKFSPTDSKILFDASSQTTIFRLDLAGDRLGFYLGSNDDGAKLDLRSLRDSFEIGWHHICVNWQWNSQTQTLKTEIYLDDRINDTFETTLSEITLQSLYLGISRIEAATLAGYRAFDGSISQIRLWNRVRSLAELRRFRYARLTGEESGLLLYLPIEAGEGNRLPNLAGGEDAGLKLGIFAESDWIQRRFNLFQFEKDTVVLPAAAKLGLVNQDFTIETWINLVNVTGSHPILSSIATKLDNTFEAFSLRVENGQLLLSLEGKELVTSDLTLANNTWHHVVCRYGDRTFSLSLDGETSSQTLEIDPVAIARTLYLGRFRQWNATAATWNEAFFQGAIDEIRIWETVRTDAQLSQNRLRRLKGDEDGLTAYWIFSDAQQRILFSRKAEHKLAYLSIKSEDNLFSSARPPIYTPRQAPVLDGYNDYLALGNTTVNLNQPHTVEFWFADETNPWQHLAAVYGNNGEISQIYRDGVLEPQQPPSELIDRLNAFLANVSPNDRPDRVTSGKIAEFRLWDGARTAEQIQTNRDRYLTGREANLCGYWRLDEGEGNQLLDKTEYLPPATLIIGLEKTAAKWQKESAPPLNGSVSALYFDGKDDRVILSDVADLKLSADFTVEAWLKLAESGDRSMPILGSADNSQIDNPPILNLGLHAGKPSFSFGANTTFQALEKVDNQWHHIAWQYDAIAKTASIFLDGELVARGQNIAPFAGSGEASIGYAQKWDSDNSSLSDRYFHGWIGEVRIWQTVRTAEQIKQNFYRPLPGTPETIAALTAYWIFDDRNQTIITSRTEIDNNLYQLSIESDMDRGQPIWESISDRPILINPLSQNAFHFDGERQYLATDDFKFTSESFTLEAWVKVEDFNKARPIIWWGDRNETEFIKNFELRVSSQGKIEFHSRGNIIPTTESIAIGTFTHIAIAVNTLTNKVKLFINAREKTTNDAQNLNINGSLLLIGKGELNSTPTYFKGLITEVRIWNGTKSAEDLQANLYSPAIASENIPDLLSYWPLTNVEENQLYAPNLLSDRPKLRLGGLKNSRKPQAGEPTEFIDARRQVLTLPLEDDGPKELPVPRFAAQNYQHRAQRTVEIWFLCKNTFLSNRQVIYQEGDRELSIYIKSGQLYFEVAPTNQAQSTIKTERIQANRWHHAAIILDGRAEVRENALCALLDGRIVNTRAASQLWGKAETIRVGDLGFNPAETDSNLPVASGENPLRGQIKEVRVWERVRTLQQIRNNLYVLAEDDRQGLLFNWDTESLPPSVVSPMILPVSREKGARDSQIYLTDLAHLHQLHQEFKSPIDNLSVLWADIKHTGIGDDRTLYDDIFNPSGTLANEYWSYTQRLFWEVNSPETAQSQIRTRLMSALRVSSSDLDLMVKAIAGDSVGRVILDGSYLTQLYRLKLLATLLKLSIGDLVRLIGILKQETFNSSTSLNDLANFTVLDIKQLKERAEWMRRTGIDLAEYDYLVNNAPDKRVALPYTEATAIDMATNLLNQCREFLLSPQSFVADEISEVASDAVYQQLKNNGAIEEIELEFISPDDRPNSKVILGVILSEFVNFSDTDLSAIAATMKWLEIFQGLYFSKDDLEKERQFIAALQKRKLIDSQGVVIAKNPEDYSIDALKRLMKEEQVDEEPNLEKLKLVREILASRKQARDTIIETVNNRLRDLSKGLTLKILTVLAELLNTTPDRLQDIIKNTDGKTYKNGAIDGVKFLKQINEIVKKQSLDSDSEIYLDLKQLEKTIFLLAQFDLSDFEIELLLEKPKIFGLQPTSLLNPSQTDLNQLHTFVELKTVLSDRGDELIKVLQGETSLSNLTRWTETDILILAERLNLSTPYNTIEKVDRLAKAFRLLRILGTNSKYLVDLANTDELNFAFYERHAAELFNLVRAKYDRDRWLRVYKPIRDLLAIQKRDRLTALALEQLTVELKGRKSPDLLYEYLLIDVQTSSAVDTSRILQGIASLQLYVQRCLMNLEAGVKPEDIPIVEWDWMKNYRVWEANRKVFLYPENYIEPELRDTKTPFFQQLEEELQQGDVNKDTVAAAYNRYLDKFAEVSNLTIVGSYLDTDNLPKGYGLKFEGTSHFTLDETLADISQKIPKDFTLEMWVKPDSQNRNGGLISANNWDSEEKGWLFRATNTSFRIHLSTRDRGEPGLMSTVSAPYTANRWYHVAATYDGSDLKLYVNGELKGSTARSGNIFYPDTNDTQIQFSLGAEKDRDTIPLFTRFIGEMREVRIWNTARTASEINESMVFGVQNPANENSLLYYWKMNEGEGDTVEDAKGSKDLQLKSGITWTSAPNLDLINQDDRPGNTLYLVGRNENTQEYYFRKWVNGKDWQPWQKIDLTINAEYVCPVFAFNKLFLFWAEIPDSVRAEDRRWVKNKFINGVSRPVDQNGKEIVLEKIKQNLTQKLPNGKTIEIHPSADGKKLNIAKQTINEEDGGTLNSETWVYRDKHDVIEQVNVTIKTPIVKYSYYNFSKTWVQPQTLKVRDLEKVELENWQQLQPKWQRVYVQRWRESDVAAPIQRSPELIEELEVAQLGPNSYVRHPLPPFSMEKLSISFWLRANKLMQTESTTEISVRTFTLFSYENETNNQILQAKLTHTPLPIGEKPQIMAAVNESKKGFEEIDNGIKAIQRFRNGSLDSFDEVELALNAQLTTTQNAADAILNDSENAQKLASETVTTIADVIGAIDSAKTAAESDSPQDIANLASNVVNIADRGVIAAEFALIIANSSDRAQTALDRAKELRDLAGKEAQDAADEASGENADLTLVNQHTDAAIQATINCFLNLIEVLENARSQEANVPKYQSGDLELKLKIGETEQTVLKPVNFAWQQVVFILEDNSNQYKLTSYIYEKDKNQDLSGKYLVDGQTLTFATDEKLAKEGVLQIGKIDNPASIPENEGQDRALMSEFRIWNYVRQKTDIEAERFQRKHGQEFGLELHLPLDSQSQLTRVPETQLKLERVFAPSVPETIRERIVLIYGDLIQTLRNNLKDIGYQYTLKTNQFAGNSYGLTLAEPNSGAIVGLNESAKIAIEDYVKNEIYPLDRFDPEDRITVLEEDINDLSEAIAEWENNKSNSVLIENRDGGTQLKITESYILDVHNQPGWFILDIGDEIFLVQIAIDDWRLQTAEERLRSISSSDSVGGGKANKFDLYFDRDFSLEVGNTSLLKFYFLRLNTFVVQTLSERLFGEGIDGLLDLESQNLEEPDFSNLAQLNSNLDREPNLDIRIIAPKYYADRTKLDNRIDFDGAYGPYYREIFFHIPFLIANQLNANQKFAEAQQWYHYIFNPTARESNGNNGSSSKDRYWRYRPFRNLSLESLFEILSNEDALDKYRQDPFDPHAIARLRINTYQKAVVMKYIDNLIDWGDFLFRQDSRESINEAIQLYVLAYNLLGPRPQSKQSRKLEQIGDYRDVQNDIDELPDFLLKLDDRNSNGSMVSEKIPFNPHRSVITRFCVPENENFLGYWERVEDRLYKIRNSLNIDGVFRSLALFQPSIDPAMLVQAAAGGLAGGLGAAIASANIPVPHYRYAFMLEKAKEMTGQTIELGNILLQALEKKDAEELTRLQHAHELNILNRITEVKKLQKEEAEASLKALEESLQSASDRYNHYDKTVKGPGAFGSSRLEIAEMTLMGYSSILRSRAVELKTTAAVVRSIPDFELGASGFGGSPVGTVRTGGSLLSGVLEAGGGEAEIKADITSTAGQLIGMLANFERRAEDWELQKKIAEREIAQIEYQIASTAARINIATREIQIHEQTIIQHKEVGDFYRRKFSSQELYHWMANRLSGLYFQSYKLAFDLAKQAERAFQFEFGAKESETYINFGYWDSRRKGLLAGEALRLDLARLEKSVLDRDRRYLEITKHISLMRLDPNAFLEFRKTGRCQFSLNELLFDRDFPGHYFRIIKSVSISIPAVIGPYQTLRATLTQTGHKTLLEPDLDGVKYLLGDEIDEPPVSIRADWRANQQIAISSGVQDSGMFELNFNDGRYLPFEGTGAVSTWLLEMPKANNPIDFNTITDVIVHLQYACKADNGQFKDRVMALDSIKKYQGFRLLSLLHEFSSHWHNFKNQESQKTLELTLSDQTFPANIKLNNDIEIEQIHILKTDGSLKELSENFDVESLEEKRLRLTFTSTKFKKEAENLLVLLSYTGTLIG